MKISDVLKEARENLEDAGIENAKFESEYIISQVLNKDRLSLQLDFNEHLDPLDMLDIFDYIDIRAEDNIPLQYLFKQADFYGRCFKVNANVLIPRPETEILVEKIKNLALSFSSSKILEIGSGSGAPAVSLALELPESHILSVDISEKALGVAKSNAEKYNVENIEFRESDLFSNVHEDYFDIIFSNPPYVTEEEYKDLAEEVKKEPKQALVAEDNGLYFYKKISEQAKEKLPKDGYILYEVGMGQAPAVKEILTSLGYKGIKIFKDLNSIERIVLARRD